MLAARKTLRFWLISGTAVAVLFAGIGLAATHFVLKSQVERFADRFTLLSSLRRQALQEYIDTAKAEITFWSLNEGLLSKQAAMVRQKEILNAVADNTNAALDYEIAVGALQAELHILARMFVSSRGYYDFFLISPAGDVLYTVKEEADLGTNLITGPWRDTGLARVYKRASAAGRKGNVVLSDFESYSPSAEAPAMFMAKAMVGKDDTVLGVLAFQLPTERINEIMRFTAGMGESGETYLVGEDLLMRSDSRFSDTSTILETEVSTASVKRALGGETGAMFTPDYRGVMVLSAFNAANIDNFRWAVMAEIDEEEVLRTVAHKRPMIAGLMFLLYSLSMWSVWYIRQGDWTGGEALAGLDVDATYSDTGAFGHSAQQ